MRLLKPLLLLGLFLIIGYGCEKTNDGFPTIRFTGYFNLNYPDYSGNSFSATYDMDNNKVGISGIIVYRASATEYYAFESMCPYEKESTCQVVLDPDDPSFAKCECCESLFLLSFGDGDIVEGPTKWPLKSYPTSVQGSILIVSSY